MAAITTAYALDRLKSQHIALFAERDRIQAAAQTDLARVNSQLAAIEDVVNALQDPKQSVAVDAILAALSKAGLKIVIADA